jgi:hypothetical protein
VLAVGDEDVRLQHLKQGQIDAAMLGPQGVATKSICRSSAWRRLRRAPARGSQEILDGNRARHSLFQRSAQPQ